MRFIRAFSSMGIRLSAAILAAAATAACEGGPGVDNGDIAVTSEPTTSTPSFATPANNAQLANAADYFVRSGDRAAYYFVSPSGRWQCAIVPHSEAGCQSASGSTMGISDAPEAVAGPDGTTTAPNAIVVGEISDARFAARREGEFSPDSGEAKELPFNTVLDAAGFRCNFQESVGVSCGSESTTKGFTFSRDGYAFRYTDIPIDALP